MFECAIRGNAIAIDKQHNEPNEPNELNKLKKQSAYISDKVALHKFVKRIYFLNTFLSILPTAVRGISSMNSMILGTS